MVEGGLILAISVALGFSGLLLEASVVFLEEAEDHEYAALPREKRSSPEERESCKDDVVPPQNRVNTTDKLRRLRLTMKAYSYDAYITPSNDEHQSEYVVEHDERMKFISGFSGSSGSAVVLQEKAALWTDSRYYLQADQEMDCSWTLIKSSEKGAPTIYEWLTEELSPGSRVGADPKLITEFQWEKWTTELKKKRIHLLGDTSNVIDEIWSIADGRSIESIGRLAVHDLKYAGKPWQDKVEDLRKALLDHDVEGTIISALDEIAWLFNLRATDFLYTPVFKAYAYVSQEHIRLYVKHVNLATNVKNHLYSAGCNNSACVQVKSYNDAFKDIGMIVSQSSGKILLSYYSSHSVVNLVPESKRVIEEGPSPISNLRAVKNYAEIKGMKSAHLKDAVAIVDFIAFLEKEVNDGKKWDEIKAAKVLKIYRAEQELNRGESFRAISAFGSNGAVVHYVPQVSTNKSIDNKGMYLLDSGGQYLDGTTDITRTFHFGVPSDFEKEAYTRVLMGAIDLMSTVFPEGVLDVDLDILARQPLREVGLDYGHGTGHGIGSYLGVHEGPILIAASRKHQLRGNALMPGMFMSDEPGYYETGKFGIRLETTMMVVNAKIPHKSGGKEYYTFEPIALVPFEPKLIKFELLTTKQKHWLNDFNVKVRNSVGVELRRQKREAGFHWLHARTEYITVSECANSAPTRTANILCAYLVTCIIVVLHGSLTQP